MRAIICIDCGGYYELNDIESVLDFESCQCGGDLWYIETSEDNLPPISVIKSDYDHILELLEKID